MHYNVDYSKLEGQDKINHAVEDCKQWLSEQQWEALEQYGKHRAISFQSFRFACSFTGIQGYPVVALWTFFGRTLNDDDLNVEEGE